MSTDPHDELAAGEVELLIDGLSDDVHLWAALSDLDLWPKPFVDGVPPTPDMIGRAFAHFDRLLQRNAVRIGKVVYVDPLQPRGTVAPVKHVAEPFDVVRQRVEAACASATDWGDWAFSCWLVNTEIGDDIANRALSQRS